MKRTVSIIVPCRNEIRYIDGFLDSLAAQDLPDNISLEILIADGQSDDGTRERLQAHVGKHPVIRLIDNPGKVVSTGLNLAILEASGDVIVRMDVHAEYAPDYVRCCLEVLEESGADNVGGPARTRAKSYLQQAISSAYHSGFACGGALFHRTDYEGAVDTVTFGCWRKETLLGLGLFDETLVRNQDDELNLRLLRKGGRIWQSPRIRCWYYPRSSLSGLFKQYAQYGLWKTRVIEKHGRPASIRHLVPGAFVLAMVLLAATAPFSAWARISLISLAGLYLAANLIASIVTCIPNKVSLLPVMPLVMATYHVSYGGGFIWGLTRLSSVHRRPSGPPVPQSSPPSDQ